jgi:murein DD-endopeptidase MepM/ murein hydrolase activator NlpD
MTVTDPSGGRRATTGWMLSLGLPAAVLVFAGASSPFVSQRVPRFVFPALAAVGAAAVLFSFVASLIRFARRFRRDGRYALFPVLVNAVAVTFLAVLPLTRMVGVMASAGSGAPRILAGFGDWFGGEGYPRPSPHRGIDVAGRIGADVLAAADGRVVVARDNGDLCGLIIVIVHDPYDYRTVYCHSSTIAVKPGDTVKRGQRIGAIGTTGQRAWPGYEHVHLELQRGVSSADIENPARRIVGCFHEAQRYPTDRLVLTYPVKC